MEKKLYAGHYIGKYLIEERVGRGGMAEVYKAYHENLNRHVAIKVMHTYLSDDDNFLNRFQREARAMATAEHPNIVHVYDFDTEADYYYIVMEYLGGGTLKSKLDGLAASSRTMKLSAAVRIILEMADALAYAHTCGMIHRDIKPTNIMFNERGSAVLTDFGIAKLLTSTSYMTNTGAMIGTPAYMSPEQGLGEPGNERSDIYSLGVLAYQLLTGRLPHEGDTPLAVVLKHINDTPVRPTVLNPDLPLNIENIVLEAMAKNQEDRYQSASQLATDLRSVLTRENIIKSDASFPASLLENRPTPLPRKTHPPTLEMDSQTDKLEYYKSLPKPPPENDRPTVIGAAGFATDLPSDADLDQHPMGDLTPKYQLEAKPTVPTSNQSSNSHIVPDWMESISSQQESIEGAPASQDQKNSPPGSDPKPNYAVKQELENPLQASGDFSQQMDEILDRLTDDPDPILTTGHLRRNERREIARQNKKKEKKLRAIHFFLTVLAIVGGISLGVWGYQEYFNPSVVGENPVQRFNAWLNDISGGSTAEEVDLSSPDLDIPVDQSGAAGSSSDLSDQEGKGDPTGLGAVVSKVIPNVQNPPEATGG